MRKTAAEAAAAPLGVENFMAEGQWERDRSRYVPARHALPHLSKREKTYFVTFCTDGRMILPPKARDIVLACCIHDHGSRHWLHCAVVMPDHVHLLTSPYEEASLVEVMSRLKGASAHRVNDALRRNGSLWQREYFDRIVRSDESLAQKAEYISNNPVRAGLVEVATDWPWFWSGAAAASAAES